MADRDDTPSGPPAAPSPPRALQRVFAILSAGMVVWLLTPILFPASNTPWAERCEDTARQVAATLTSTGLTSETADRLVALGEGNPTDLYVAPARTRVRTAFASCAVSHVAAATELSPPDARTALSDAGWDVTVTAKTLHASHTDGPDRWEVTYARDANPDGSHLFVLRPGQSSDR